jgi:hypothetical protein
MDMSMIPPGADLSLIPAGMPPNGTMPNFIDPPSLKIATLGVAIPLMIIATLCVVLRLAERLREKKVGAEDIFAIFALLISYAYMGSVFARMLASLEEVEMESNRTSSAQDYSSFMGCAAGLVH